MSLKILISIKGIAFCLLEVLEESIRHFGIHFSEIVEMKSIVTYFRITSV